MILDTVVLVDLEREITRGKAGPAMAALKRFANQELFLTPDHRRRTGSRRVAAKARRLEPVH
jgi:hypothetical protein